MPKIRLIDSTEYPFVDSVIQNSTLNIVFENQDSEVLQTAFKDESNLSKIDLIAEDGGVYGYYENYTKYAGLFLKDNTCIVYLTQPVDELESRVGTIESTVNALSSQVSESKQNIDSMKESIVDKETSNAILLVSKSIAQNLSDQDAIQCKKLYSEWQLLVDMKYTAQNKGFKFVYTNDTGVCKLFKTAQDNLTFQSQYVPGSQGTESIYTVIDESHAGTQEDPIPYEKNMELFEGKYYTQNDQLYLCIRNSGIAMQYDLEDLISGRFVQKV